jgi:hypothetical protein
MSAEDIRKIINLIEAVNLKTSLNESDPEPNDARQHAQDQLNSIKARSHTAPVWVFNQCWPGEAANTIKQYIQQAAKIGNFGVYIIDQGATTLDHGASVIGEVGKNLAELIPIRFCNYSVVFYNGEIAANSIYHGDDKNGNSWNSSTGGALSREAEVYHTLKLKYPEISLAAAKALILVKTACRGFHIDGI